MVRFLPHSLLVLFCLSLLSARAVARPIHNFPRGCETCHLTTPQRGAEPIFTQPSIDLICLRCHSLPSPYNHPTGVRYVGTPLPSGFWLDGRGRLNCATCHDPHLREDTGNPDLLRGSARGSDFCRNCHPQLAPKTGRHLAVSAIAHPHTTPASGDEDALDDNSLSCLDCHDGSAGSHVRYCLLGQKGQCTGHILGIDYVRASLHDKHLLPLGSLSPAIVLPDGRVGCGSCHNIYAPGSSMLAVDNRGSALCLECHVK